MGALATVFCSAAPSQVNSSQGQYTSVMYKSYIRGPVLIVRRRLSIFRREVWWVLEESWAV